MDISREEEFEKLPKEDVYAVIYLAAVIPSYMEEYNPESYIKTNIVGTYHVLEYCRRVHADVFMQTGYCFPRRCLIFHFLQRTAQF